MTLDAVVYCNCYETGRLRELPPCPECVYVSEAGYLNCHHTDLEVVLEFDRWLLLKACEHRDGVLFHHFLGNIARIGTIRNTLSHKADLFPIVLDKVVYSGSHTGDYLALEDVERLTGELTYLTDFHADDPAVTQIVHEFHRQMSELVEASRSVGKPIAF